MPLLAPRGTLACPDPLSGDSQPRRLLVGASPAASPPQPAHKPGELQREHCSSSLDLGSRVGSLQPASLPRLPATQTAGAAAPRPGPCL